MLPCDTHTVNKLEIFIFNNYLFLKIIHLSLLRSSEPILFSNVSVDSQGIGWAIDVLGQIWFTEGVTTENPVGSGKWWQVFDIPSFVIVIIDTSPLVSKQLKYCLEDQNSLAEFR